MVKRAFFVLVVFLSAHIYGEESYWDYVLVRNYVHHSELQERWSWSFLAPRLKEIDLDERILDIGCGDGRISAVLAKCVPHGLVIGIDPSHAMLDWAKKQYVHQDYPNLSFQEGSFLQPGIKVLFDRVVSFCALQHCTDIQQALENMIQMVRPGGKLLILVPSVNNPAWNKARAAVQSLPEWEPYWRHFVPRKFPSPEQYKEWLEQAHLDQIFVERIQTADPFIDRQELLDWFKGTFASVLPKELSEKFYNAWIDEYIRLDPSAVGDNGVIYAKLGYIQIEATRKQGVHQ
jgi:trans-aconitate 2-methyltransferase